MQVVILAGGLGTRLCEETESKPKPMVTIGGKPMLWHIMKIYSHFGFNDFIICLGYKGYVIKEYFANYFLHTSDVSYDIAKNEVKVHRNDAESWRVTLVETGTHTMTGGRLKQVSDYIKDDHFCFTYGDGVANIDIKGLVDYHHSHGRLATVTAVQPPGRFGVLQLQNNQVTGFHEKCQADGDWINGGFFVLSPQVLELLEDDETIWEHEPLQTLAREDQLVAYKHKGFWQPMDMLRERKKLQSLWDQGNAPWKVWT